MNRHSGFPDIAVPARIRWLRWSRRALAIGAAVGWLCLPAAAQTSRPLDEWRTELTRTRQLAESDAPLAYERALRLQGAAPDAVTAADRARLLNLLARIEIYLAQTERSIQHADQAFELAASAGDKIGQAEADLNMALNSVNEARIDRLVTATTRSLAELEGMNRPDLLGEALLRTAMMYRRVGQIDDSVTMAMQAMEIARRVNDPLALTYAHQGLAISFDQSFRYEEAREHYRQMREQARAAQSKQLEAYAIVGLGNLEATLGDAGAGEQLMREAVAMFRETGAPFATAFGLSQLAYSLRRQSRYGEALSVLDQVVATYEQYPNRIGLWYGLNARSANHESLGNARAANADAQRAYAIAKEIAFPLYVSESAQRLAGLAAAAGDYPRAYALGTEANEMTAQAAREKTSARMVQMAQRYESESRQREIVELTQRNRQQTAELRQAELRQRLLWTVLAAGVVIFAMTVYFLLRLRRSRSDLQQQTSILRSVLDSMADGVVVADASGQLTVVNPSARRILGVGLVGEDARNWSRGYGLYLPDQATHCPADELPLVRALTGASSDNVELFARPAAANEGRWLSATARPLTDANGVARGGVIVFSDVTARKRAEAELRVRAQEFRALVEHSPDLVARYDADCRRTYANPALAEGVGVTVDALLGARPTDLTEMPADQARDYERCLGEVFATGREGLVDVTVGEASIQFRLVAELDLHGRVGSVLAIGRDITALMETQRQLATLLANLPDMVARFDSQGRFVYVNPAVTRAFGMPAERFTGRTSREVGLDPTGMLGDALKRVARDRVPCLLEVPLHGPEGERTFEVRYVPELDDRGNLNSIVGLTREVTERKRVDRLVRDLAFRREAAREDERRHIARELHDELGQLLSALRLEVSVVRMRYGSTHPALAERAAGMLALVDSVIRLQRDLVSSLRPAVLDLGIGTALEWLVGQFAERNGVACNLSMSEASLDLDADQTTMVFRIAQESLTNVSRHAKATRVSVELERVADAYLLSIRDDGHGFDPQAPRDPRSLGLAGMNERAQMLGGRLDIRSGAGGGVAVVVHFPAQARASTSPSLVGEA